MKKFKYFIFVLLAITATIAFAAATDKYIASQGNIVIKTAASKTVGIQDSLYTKQTGEVGIGTASPGTKLHVSGSSYPQFEIDDTASRGWGFGVTSSKFFVRDITGTSDVMTFIPGGNVGIGTPAPYTTLDLYAANKGVGDWGILNVRSSSSFGIDKGGSIVFGGKHNTGGSDADLAGIAGRKENATDGNTAGYLQFSTFTNGDAGASEKMRLSSTGVLTVGKAFFYTAYNTNKDAFAAASSANYFSLNSGQYVDFTLTGGCIITLADASQGSTGYVGYHIYGGLTSLAFDAGSFNNADSGTVVRVFRPSAGIIRVKNSFGASRAVSMTINGCGVSVSAIQ